MAAAKATSTVDDPKQIYEQKRQNLEKTQDTLEDFVERLRSLAEILDRWDRILLPEETKERNGLYNLGNAEPHELDPDACGLNPQR